MHEVAVHAVSRSALRCVLLMLLLIGSYALLPLRGDNWWLGAVLGVAMLVAIAPVVVHRLRKVLASDRPGLDAFEGLVVLVTMLIVGFAAVYYGIDHDPGEMSGLETRLDAVYFTVTTLSTVGFGDIHASGQTARLIVTLQILINAAFVGIIARVLVRAATHRAGQRSSPDP